DADVLSTFEGRRVLITGAAGFIGAAILHRLAGVRCTVRCLTRGDRLASVPESFAGRVEAIQGDVREPETWLAAVPGVDVVFHLASQTSVYTAEADPPADWAANVAP